MHADEVAHLPSIFEDQWRTIVHEPRRENRCNSGIRIGQRLTCAIDVEEAQRYDGQLIDFAEEQTHLLLILLRKRIN